MMSRKFFLLVFLHFFCSLVFVQWAFASGISQEKAASIARNFLNSQQSFHTIESVTAFTHEGQKAGYLMNLAPAGYILIASDTVRVPVKAYSMKSNFDLLPPTYVKALGKELLVPELFASANNDGAKTPPVMQYPARAESVNQAYWNFLTQKIPPPSTKRSRYVANSHLLTTQWDQDYPYNKFFPRYGGERTLTGCVQTAAAQIMRYYAWPQKGSGVFTHTWNGQTLTTSMNRPFHWNIMPDSVGGSSPEYVQEEVAALMLDLAILNENEFGTASQEGSASYFHMKSFAWAFGYAPIREMYLGNPAYFDTIKEEIDNDRPLLLELPGHMTVADGYASDGTGKKVHINMGWGGMDNHFYYLDQSITTTQFIFPANNRILYNIQPCQGSQCKPYSPRPSGPPVIRHDLKDMILAPGVSKTIRVDAYHPGGQDMNFSFTSSCPGIIQRQAQNLLTIGADQPGQICDIVVRVTAQGQSTSKTCTVLVTDSDFSMGKEFDLGGTFEDNSQIYQHRVFLEGLVTIRGDNGFSRQGFYTWIKDANGNTVVSPLSEADITYNAAPGFYTIYVSLSESGWYYDYDPAHSQYILTVRNQGLNTSVRELAEQMGIDGTPDPGTSPEPGPDNPVEVFIRELSRFFLHIINNFEMFRKICYPG